MFSECEKYSRRILYELPKLIDRDTAVTTFRYYRRRGEIGAKNCHIQGLGRIEGLWQEYQGSAPIHAFLTYTLHKAYQKTHSLKH